MELLAPSGVLEVSSDNYGKVPKKRLKKALCDIWERKKKNISPPNRLFKFPSVQGHSDTTADFYHTAASMQIRATHATRKQANNQTNETKKQTKQKKCQE